MGYIDDLRKEYQELTKQKAQENTKYNVPTSLINQYKNEYAQLTGQAQQPVEPTISQPNFANHASMSQQGHQNIAQKQANMTIGNQSMTDYVRNGGTININDANSLARLAAEQGVPSQQIAQATQNTNNQGIGGIANRIGTEIKNNNLFDDVNTSKYFEYENKLEDAKARGDAVDTAVYQNLIDRMDEDYKPKTKNWYRGKQNLQEHEQNIGTTIDILKYYEDKVLNAKTPEEVQEYLPKYQQEYKNYQNAVSRYQDAKLYNKYNGNPVLDELDILGYTGASTLSGILDETIENVHNDSEVLRGKSFDYIKPSELIKENNARKSGTIPANLQRLSLSMNALREQATRENATDDLKNLYEQIMNGTYTGTEEDIQRVLDNARDEKYKLEAKENVNTKLRQKKEEFDYNYQPSPEMKYVLENGLEQVIGMTPIYAANLVSPFLGDATMYQSAANSAYDRARENGATASQARANKTLSGLAEAGFEHLVQSSIDKGFERGGLLKPTEWAENIANPLIRTGVGIGVDVTGEGLEEVASEVTQPIIDRITYDPNAKMATVEEVWGAFTGSILPTLIMQGAGYTLQKVDTFVNKAKSNINNSNLTDLQKAELINQVENGRKEILKQIEQRKQEIDTQAKQTNQNNQIARDTEALNLQPQQTSAETMQRNVENSAQNKTIAEKVKELNKLGYNIPQSTANTLQAIQDVRGTRIEFDNTIDGNGVYDAKNRIVYLNPNSTRAIEFTIAHELGHDIKAGNLEDYNKLQKAVLDYAGKQQGFTKGMKALDNTYKSKLGEGNYIIEDEMTNDILGEVLGNQEFLDSLAQEQPKLFERIWNWIKNVLIDNTNGRLSFNERRLLNKYEQGFRNAYQKAFNATKPNSNLQYSLETTSDGIQYLKDEPNKYTNPDGTKMTPKQAFNTLVGKELDLGNGDKVKVVKYLKANIGKNKNMYHEFYERIPAHYNMTKEEAKYVNGLVNDNAEDVLTNSNYLGTKPDQNGKHANYNITDFDTREIYLYDGNTAYRIQLSIGQLTNGQKIAYAKKYYDIDGDLTQKIKADEARRINSSKNQQPLFNNNIPPTQHNVNTQHSLSEDTPPTQDNQGRKLSEGQQEYFKDSKARDENGNLLVVYHGSPNERFYVFDKKRAATGADNGSEGDYGSGFYFAKDKEYSKEIIEKVNANEFGFEPRQKEIQEQIETYEKQLQNLLKEERAFVRKKTGKKDIADAIGVFDKYPGLREKISDFGKEMSNLEEKIKTLKAANKQKPNIKKQGFIGEYYIDLKNPLRLDLYSKASQEIENISTDISDKLFEEKKATILEKYGFTNKTYDIAEQFFDRIGDQYYGFGDVSKYGYDGVISEDFREIIALEPNQIKSVDNLSPTDNEDIRYSKQNNTWQQFLDDTYGKWNTGTRTNFTKTDTTMLPSNEELQEQENKGINAILKDLKILTNEELQNAERESIKNEPIVQANKITPTKRLDDVRDFKKVGDRKVNAYQYDNPEVKPFFQQEAKNMLYDLNNAIKGERTATWDNYGELHYSGVTRETAKDIADLLDGKNGVKLSYADIEKGLNAIIEDKGSENIAAAKRIEMVLDKRLREGYTDSYGTEYEPNDNYLNFLAGKDFIDPAEYDKQVQDKLIADYEAENDDGTLFSLSEEQQKEVSDYVDKIYEDNTLDEEFRDRIAKRLNAVDNYSKFEDIKQEVEDYKDKMYKGISGLEDIANLKQEDVKQREMTYKQRKDKNTTNQRKFFENAETSPIIAEQTKNNVNATTYEQKANLDTLEEVRQKLDERGNDLVEEWKSKQKNFTSKDVALGAILIERYQQAGDWQSAARTVEKLADMGTEAGRAVQMYSIFQRLSPETMAIYQQKALDKAFEEMKQRKTGKWVEANKDKYKLTAEDTQFIYEQVEKASQAVDEETKQRELSKIENRINEKLPPEDGQTIKALRRIAMLFNPKTQVRNIVGNAVITPVNDVADFIGSKIDKLISKKTGARTTNNPNLITKAKGFKKGIKDAITDYKTGTRTAPTGSKYEFDFGARAFNENTNNKTLNAINRKLNGINDLLSAVMSGGDRPFYEAAYQNSLEGQMKANKVTEPTQDMIDIAVNEALQRTWNDDNEYTKAVLGIRRAMNHINIHGFGLGDLIIPFAKTPANLTKAMVEYSPVGFLEAAYDFNDMRKAISRGEMTPMQQKRFVNATSKAITGSMLYMIAAMLVKSGVITGSADDDKDVKNFEQNVLGIQPYSVKVGDKTYTYSWANPINAPLAIMADTYKMSKENASKWDVIKNAFKVAGETLVDNSFLQGIKELFSKDSISEGLVEAIESFPESLIPTFMSQIASLGDEKQRQTFEYQNDFKTISNKIKNKLPGARNTLEPQVNTFGEEIENQNTAFNAFLNPANVREARITDEQKALYDVYQETKDKTIFPMQAPYYTNTDNGEKKNLSSKDRVDYQKASGKYVNDIYKDLFQNDRFIGSSNEEKVKILHEIATDGNTKGREAVGAIETSTNSNLSKLNEKIETLEDAGIPLADFYIAWYAKNNHALGKTHTAQKKAIRDYTDLSAKQEEVLYEIFNIK